MRARMLSHRLIVAMAVGVAAVACSSSPLQPESADASQASDRAQSQAPSVASISPTSGPVGTKVTIKGSGFARRNAATFGQGFLRDLESTDGATITFTVPDGLDLCSPEATGPCAGAYPRTRAGDYAIAIMLDGQKSNALTFTVTP